MHPGLKGPAGAGDTRTTPGDPVWITPTTCGLMIHGATACVAKNMTRVPQSALWLGALGALPFVGLALAGFVLEGSLRAQASFALVAYGATILSFLGGIHWGLAIAPASATEAAGAKPGQLVVSVIPSLVAWSALLLPDGVALLALAAAFALMLLVDLRAVGRLEAPDWYPKLRAPLTLAVVASLVIGAVG